MQDLIVEPGSYSVVTEDGNELLLSKASYESYLKLKEEHLKEEENIAKNLMNLADDAMKEVDQKWQQVEELFHSLKTKKPFDYHSINTKIDMRSNRVIDDLENARVKEKPRLFTLRRTILGAVISFGLFAAIESVPKFFMSQNHQIVVETPKDPMGSLGHKSQDIKGKGKYKKSGKKLGSSTMKIRDFISLNDATLYYTSQEGKPSVKSRSLDCDSYKIRYISIISEDYQEVLENIKINSDYNQVTLEEFKNNYQSLYGNRIHFQMNVDGYQNGKLVCKKAGWTSTNNIKKIKVNKVFKKVK